jgi:hypothetical protein
MPRYALTFTVLLLAFCAVGEASAQFSSPAFDPQCYFPSVNDPTETNVTYGTNRDQLLGSDVLTIPQAGLDYSLLFVQGLPDNRQFFTALGTGPHFDVRSPSIVGQTNVEILSHYMKLGHFHRRDKYDLLMTKGPGGWPRVYWADDFGLYDTNRYSEVRPSYWLDSLGASLDYFNVNLAYAAPLTSDTLDDLLFSGVVAFRDGTFEDRLFLFRGQHRMLGKQDTIIEDTSLSFRGPNDTLRSAIRLIVQGDWRGVGRTDLIAFTADGGFYFRNDPPFSLEKLRWALGHDTLFAASEDSNYNYSVFSFLPVFASAHAFPRFASDRSEDLIISCSYADGHSGSIRMFRGGSDFGTKRLNLSHPGFLLKHPRDYDANFTYLTPFLEVKDVGDMTGTGNRVLYAETHDRNSTYYHFFYVMGDALDDKADMFITDYKGVAFMDTLTANADGMQDIILGMPAIDNPQKPQATNAGRLEVVYGTTKIPVRKNGITPTVNKSTIDVFPNPASNKIAVTGAALSDGPVMISLLDELGRVLWREARVVSTNSSALNILLPALPAAAYTLELTQRDRSYRTHLLIRQ